MDVDGLVNLLRDNGITVQRVAPLPRAAGSRRALVVFLDPTRNQRRPARVLLRQVPGVQAVKPSRITPWALFVTLASTPREPGRDARRPASGAPLGPNGR